MLALKMLRILNSDITSCFLCVLLFLQFFDFRQDKIQIVRGFQNEITGFIYWGPAEEIENVFLEACGNDKIRNEISVRLEGHDLSRSEIQFLKKLNVRELHLGDSPTAVCVNTSIVEAVGDLADLRVVTIDTNESRNIKWRSLKKLKDLRRLELLGNSKLDADDLRAISSLSNLQTLDLKISAQCKKFDWLEKLTSLTELRIYGKNHLGGNLAKSLTKLPNLSSLEIFGFALNASDLSALAKSRSKGLIELETEIGNPTGVLNELSKFSELKRLYLTFPQGTELDFSSLSKLPDIEHLCIRGATVPVKAELSWIKKHPSIKTVKFTNRLSLIHI